MAEILIVEDDPDYMDYMKSVLEKDGHAVTEATDGRKALEALSGASFDAVVTDIIMPEMDGRELIEEMHRVVDGYTPVVAITGGGEGDPSVILDAVSRLGVAASLEKPVSPESLTKTIRRVLEPF